MKRNWVFFPFVSLRRCLSIFNFVFNFYSFSLVFFISILILNWYLILFLFWILSSLLSTLRLIPSLYLYVFLLSCVHLVLCLCICILYVNILCIIFIYISIACLWICLRTSCAYGLVTLEAHLSVDWLSDGDSFLFIDFLSLKRRQILKILNALSIFMIYY